MNKHKCRTYFRISGDFDSKEILEKLGIEAYKIKNKGEINHKSKRISFRDEITIGFNDKYDIDVNEMIRETIKALLPKKETLAEIYKKYSVDFYLVIVPEIYSDSDEPNQILSLDRDIIEFLYLTQTEIDLDYYVY